MWIRGVRESILGGGFISDARVDWRDYVERWHQSCLITVQHQTLCAGSNKPFPFIVEIPSTLFQVGWKYIEAIYLALYVRYTDQY